MAKPVTAVTHSSPSSSQSAVVEVFTLRLEAR